MRLDIAYIAQNLRGAWLVIRGRREGLSVLDISEDGVWRSFQAMLVALPALALSWASNALHLSRLTEVSASSVLFKSFAAELIAWFVPIVAFAFLARLLGLTKRFAHFVVANNWVSVFLSYAVLIIAPFELLGSGFESLALVAHLLVFVMSLVVIFRMIHVVVDGSLQTAIAVFLIIVLVSILTLFLLQSALGLTYPAPSAG